MVYTIGRAAVAVAQLPGWVWQVIRHQEPVKGFVLLPRRREVERSYARMRFYRRFQKMTNNSPATVRPASMQLQGR